MGHLAIREFDALKSTFTDVDIQHKNYPFSSAPKGRQSIARGVSPWGETPGVDTGDARG
jgi:hypothetical protein